MSATISSAIEPLIKRKVFANEEEAIRTLLREYLLAEIAKHRREVKRFERSYGLDFQ